MVRKQEVGIIGAGVSGLLACKYILQKGFNPIVFEAEPCIGGVWLHTPLSTRLQNIRPGYCFSDFPWPPSVKDRFPTASQVKDYLESYATYFGINSCIKFNSKVLGIDYVGQSNQQEMESWYLWGGTGKPFASKGNWHIRVQDTKNCTTAVYQVDFVILCIGAFSGLPNIPEFPPNKGPQVFKGKVMHSMDYGATDNQTVAELIKRKRITIVGSNKSAMDIAVDCARANGVEYPCLIIQRTIHWRLPGNLLCAYGLGFLYFTRFSELLVHKPGESFALSTLATLLSPLRWGISKLIESYLKWSLPLKKLGLIPEHSFDEAISSCQIAMLPDNFYENVEEGSIVIRKAQSFSFCKEGLVLGGESEPLETDTVILATGFKSDEKMKNIFESSFFQQQIMGSPILQFLSIDK